MEAVIRTAILDALKELGIEPVDFVVEHPADLSHGDYATNVAMVAAKQVGQAPRELAEQIRAALAGEIEYVETIDIAGPGFINFHLARDFFAEEAQRATAVPAEWGKNGGYEGWQMLIEYTSPNLFKPLHIGNLMGNIVGESLARLYEFSGADVKRLNYPSDIGLTVAKGVWGLQQTGGDPEDIAALGEAYRTGNEAYDNDESAKAEIEHINRALYEGSDDTLNALREKGIATSLARLDELCRQLGTTFDHVIFESEAGTLGQQLVTEHTGSVFKESEGAVIYEGEKHGLHTRVFLNSQGLPTYEAKDLGNFALKQKQYPDWDASIVVTGAEQAEYFKVLIAAIREVFAVPEEKVLTHVPTGFLTLTTGKMSSRKGNVLTGESMLAELQARAVERAEESRSENIKTLSEEVAVAALKYAILSHGLGTDIVFDKEKALSFEGDSGPYLQYTHARINSVAAKAVAAGVAASVAKLPSELYPVEQLLYRFPEVVAEAAAENAPQKLVSFLTDLAGAFNTFYAQEQIADPSDQHAPYKLLLTQAVGQTLENGLWLLGIKAPKRM